MVGRCLRCDAVEGRFLQAADLPGLREACRHAEAEGAGAVFLTDGPLGDAIVLAAGMAGASGSLLLGVRADLGRGPHRHPSVLAREMTALDHVCGGRSMLAFLPPHGEAVTEAARLCRAMWQQGTVVSDGPAYPVAGAVNLPMPPGPDSPRLALDLTDGSEPAPDMRHLVDFLLVPSEREGVCQVQPA
jgi:alkanesulfonate monooxygenase SsuD/methylene tetrahydromethanopterin reductase-like flavin-dependent oxidoreductase (luciferase family)